jgi:hypothetical protein
MSLKEFTFTAVALHKRYRDGPQVIIQESKGRIGDAFGYAAIEGLRNSARNARLGIAVAAKRYGATDGILVACRFQEGDDGLGNAPLAGHIEAVARPYLVKGV